MKLRHLQIIVWRYKIRIEINLSEENIMSEQYELNKNLAQMLKGGVIMDVTTPEQALLWRWSVSLLT